MRRPAATTHATATVCNATPILRSLALFAVAIASTTAGAAQHKGGPSPPQIVVSASNPGAIPDATGMGCNAPGAALDLQFDVPAFPGYLVEDVDVSLTFAPAHMHAGDVVAVLSSPDRRRSRTLFGRTLTTVAEGCGDFSDLAGPYVFSDAATPPSGGWWQAAAAGNGPIAAGSYFPTDAGGAGAIDPMPATSMARIFAGLNSAHGAGTWHVRVTDLAQGDTGAISAAQLTLQLRAPSPESLIYANGVLETGTVSADGTAAPTGMLWSELQENAGNPGEANRSLGFFAIDQTNRLADDFEVPPGQLWQLSGIVLFAHASDAPASPSPFVSANVRIWGGPPGEVGSELLCGDGATNTLAGSTPTSSLRIPHTMVSGLPASTNRAIWRNVLSLGACHALRMPPGVYWIDWASTVSGGLLHAYPSNTYIGARTVAGDNARQLDNGVWGPALDTGLPANNAPDLAVDFPFQLMGTVEPAELRVFKDGFEILLD